MKKKLQFQLEQAKLSEPASKPENTESASVEPPSPSFDVQDAAKDTAKNDAGSAPGAADESSITSKSVALLKRLNISEGFFSLKTLLELALARLSAATSVWANVEARVLRFGALVALFLFIFIRHRHTWKRY